MKIYIGSDHGGYVMKEALKKYLNEQNFEVEDLGAEGLDPDDDYPKFADKVAKAVAANRDSLGILLCRSGQGVCMVANKTKGIRAALSWNEDLAKASRCDDHANVLCLPSDYINEDVAEKIAETFIKTFPCEEERFIRRIKEVEQIENS